MKTLKQHLQELETKLGYLHEYDIRQTVKEWLQEHLKETNCGDWLDANELIEELKQ